MKSAKYLAVVLAVITMAFMLAACGNTQDDTKLDSSPSTIASEPATEETTIPEATPPSNDAQPSSLYRNALFLIFIHLILKYNKEPIAEMKGEIYNDLLGRR